MDIRQTSGKLLRPIGHIQHWSQITLGLLLPPTCAFCGKSLDTDLIQPQLCSACRPIFTPKRDGCKRCGAIRRPSIEPARVSKCSECAKRKFAFDEVISLGAYEGLLGHAVLRMKYEAGQSLAFALGRHLGQHIERKGHTDCYDLVTCATKYWMKRLFTGINSPEVVMHGIAGQANLPHAADLLVCRRRISKQSSLSPAQRRRNVRNAWTVSDMYDIAAARILLVDDILTTGATAHEMSRALKRAGAKQVTVAVVGRAIKW